MQGGRGGIGTMAMEPSRRAIAPAASAQNRCEVAGGTWEEAERVEVWFARLLTAVGWRRHRMQGGRGGIGTMAMTPSRRAVASAASAQSRCEVAEEVWEEAGRVEVWFTLLSTAAGWRRRRMQGGRGGIGTMAMEPSRRAIAPVASA